MAAHTITNADTGRPQAAPNDKALQKQYDSYTDKLDDWEDKIEAYRERFEKKFSNMEVAMSKLQSQTSAMASFFGISQ